MDESTWNSGWGAMEPYENVFQQYVFQNVLISMRSQWDWYIRKLADFVVFARNFAPSPELSNQQAKSLTNIGFKELHKQLPIIEIATGISINVVTAIQRDLTEMSQVRNLGLHNRWEVDKRYTEKTNHHGWEENEIRVFNEQEITKWQHALMHVIEVTAYPVSQKYVAVPQYPI